MAGYQFQGGKRNGAVAVVFSTCLAILSVVTAYAYYKHNVGTETTAEATQLAIAVSSNRLDFGNVPLAGSVVRQLIVRNDGTEPIRAELAVNSSRFSVSPGELILHPGISSRISVAAAGQNPGAFDDELHIRVGQDDLVVGLAGTAGDTETPAPAPAPALPRVSDKYRASNTDAAGRAPATGTAPRPGGIVRSSKRVTGPNVVHVADASISSKTAKAAGDGPSTKATKSDKTRQRRTRANDDGSERPQTRGRIPEGASATIRPYDPATAVPFRSIAEKAQTARAEISAADAENAAQIPPKTIGEDGLPDSIDEDDTDPWDRDIFDEEDEDPAEKDPFRPPTLTISGQSTIRLMGSSATFYPQQITVMGAEQGGPLTLTQELRFPQVPLAFGESMVFAQAAPVSGGYDASSGEISFQLPLQAVDSDGDAAPMVLNLTTGTVLARNEAGIVVSLSGTPRAGSSGVMRLVAIEKIPVGFRNGGEEHLAVFEILAELEFGNNGMNSSAPVSTNTRIGG